MASKIRRWLRELAVWLLIGAAVSPAVDYFRQPALPQNVSATSLQTLDGRTLDLNAISQQKPLLLYVWATVRSLSLYHAVGGIACRRRRQCADCSPAFRR